MPRIPGGTGRDSLWTGALRALILAGALSAVACTVSESQPQRPITGRPPLPSGPAAPASVTTASRGLNTLCDASVTRPSDPRAAWLNAFFVRTTVPRPPSPPVSSTGHGGVVRPGQRGMALALGREPASPGDPGGQCLFATASHVVEGAQEIMVGRWTPLPGQPPETPARVVWASRDIDAAILKANLGDCPSTPSFHPRPAPGDDIVALGQLDLYRGAITKGIVSGYWIEPPRPFPSMRSDILLSPGHSGGPVLTTAGEVVGLAIAKSADATGLSTIAPICEVLAGMPANLQIAVGSEKNAPPPSRPEH